MSSPSKRLRAISVRLRQHFERNLTIRVLDDCLPVLGGDAVTPLLDSLDTDVTQVGGCFSTAEGVDDVERVHAGNTRELNYLLQGLILHGTANSFVQTVGMGHWGQRLDYAATRRGKGPTEISEATGISVESIKKYRQSGVDKPRGNIIAKLAEYLEVPELWLEKGMGRDPFDDEISDNQITISTVSEVDVRASAGAGSVVDYEPEGHRWGFPEAWVRLELVARPRDLRIITIEGDSMISDPPSASDLAPGCKVIVNIADRAPTPPGIFILHDGIGLVAKRVEHIDGSDPATIRILSNNERYNEYNRTMEEIRIMGRVVGRWQRL